MKMRLSRITEHNQFEETDHLYDPLRNTLKKSSVSKAKSLAHASSPHQLRGSNVSRVIRNLQPEEALEMQKNIYIPTDRRLYATQHLHKIQGKSFYAVEVQERKGAPISEEEFKRRFKGMKIQKTLYDFSSNPNSKKSSPPLLSKPSSRKAHTGIRPLSNRVAEARLIATKKSAEGEGKKLFSQSKLNQMFNQQFPISRRSSSKYTEGEGIKIQKNIDTHGEENMVRTRRIESEPVSGLKRGKLFKVPTNKETVTSQLNYGQIDQRKSSISSKSRKESFKEKEVKSQVEETERSQVHQQSTKSSRSSNSSVVENRSRYGLKSSPYKYNLFSSLDEAVDTKCGSFGKHELVASKPKQSWDN